MSRLNGQIRAPVAGGLGWDVCLGLDPVGDGHRGLTAPEHRRLADMLLDAAADRRPVAPLSLRYPELTVADATRIRDSAVGRRVAAGERLVGAMAAVSGRFGRRLAWVTDAMLVDVPDPATFIGPRFEPAVALRLAHTLVDTTVTGERLLAAAGHVVPCLAVLDSRLDPGPRTAADALADNCSLAGIVLRDEAEPGPSVATAALDLALWLVGRLLEHAPGVGAGTLLVVPAQLP